MFRIVRIAALITFSGAVFPACKAESVSAASQTGETELISVSLCADSYLLALAPDEIGGRIKGLSWQAGSTLSTLPSDSPPVKRYWNSREYLFDETMTPVLGPGDQSERADAVKLEWGEDFEAVAQNLALLGEMTGIETDHVFDEIQSLERLNRPETPPKILYLSRSGGSAGPGTFVDAVIRKAGAKNIVTHPGWHTPTLEAVLRTQPDIILTSFFGSDYAGISDRAVRHGALRDFIARHPRVDLPGKLWPCAGPGLIEATRRLNKAVLSWDMRHGKNN